MKFKIFSIGESVTWDRVLLHSCASDIVKYKRTLGEGPYTVTGIYDLETSRLLTDESEIRACETQAVLLDNESEPISSMWLESTSQN